MKMIIQDELESQFKSAQDEQLALCDQLEEIADSLPDNVDRQICIHTARALLPVISRAHRMEEDILFPLVEKTETAVTDTNATLERLRIEHAGDECFVEELVDVLMSYGAGAPSQTPETTGYMLRGFFQGLRRHIAFEKEILGPMLSRTAPSNALYLES